MADSLHIAFVASEMAPFVKTGGLADVVGALPKALGRLGHRVTVFLPRYGPIAYPAGRVRWAPCTCRWTRPPQRGLLPRASSGERVRVIFVELPALLRPAATRTATAAATTPTTGCASRSSPARVLEYFRSPRRASGRVPRPRLAGGPRARVPEVVLLGRTARSTARPPCSPSTTWRTRGTSPPTRWPSSACPGTSRRANGARVPRRRQLHEGRRALLRADHTVSPQYAREIQGEGDGLRHRRRPAQPRRGPGRAS